MAVVSWRVTGLSFLELGCAMAEAGALGNIFAWFVGIWAFIGWVFP